MSEQYFTTCKRCGKQILMTKCLKNGTWIACDPEIRRFQQTSKGAHTYVMEDGELMRGETTYDGHDFGYRKHRKDCMR